MSQASASAAVAQMVSAIERAAADLAIAEEPARFAAALEAGAEAPAEPAGAE